MMSRVRRAVVTCAVAITMVALVASPANATAILRLDAGGDPVEFVDNGCDLTTPFVPYCDSNSAVGVIGFTGAIGVFSLNITNGITKPIFTNTDYVAEIDLVSFHMVAAGAGTLIVTFADTGFTLNDSPASVTAHIGGAFLAPGSVTAEAWLNPNNLSPLPGTVIPAGSVPILTPALTFGTGAFSGTDGASVPISGPFALFERTTLVFTGPGSASYDFDTTASVPEPTSLLLFGGGLLVVCGLVRKSRKSANAIG